MTIELDDATFRQLFAATVGGPPLDRDEARIVIEIAQLAGSIDLDEPSEEQTLLGSLVGRLCDLGKIDAATIPPLSPTPTDDEERATRIAQLTGRLERQGTRELAYALAYLVTVADVELSPIESTLLDELQRTLAIPLARARVLIETASQLVTPPEPPVTAERHDGRAPLGS